MKCEAKTEQEMHEADAPAPDTLAELSAYIESLTEREHEYGTCVYAMSLAAVAAFNHVAQKLGVTGFQASCADMDILRRTRQMDGPFMLVDAHKMLYPQYSIHAKVGEAMNEWLPWAAVEARKLLDKNDRASVSQRVWQHWEQLAALHTETTA